MPQQKVFSSATIRLASKQDIPSIAKVHVDTWRTTYAGIVPQEYLDALRYETREALWQNILSRKDIGSHNVVALDKICGVVGFSSGGPSRDSDLPFDGEVYALYLMKSHQGQGIGEQLLIHTFTRLLNDGFKSALVWVLEENPTRTFYEAMGGTLVGEKWDEIGGKDLKELGYGWEDLDQTLERLNRARTTP